MEEYREPHVKYYEISFSGATHKDSRNNGKLQFSVEGMKQAVEVSLAPTVERIDMDVPENNSDSYRFKFNKLHLSEIGLALEGADTRNTGCEYCYNIELMLSDGTKELLQKKMNENGIVTRNSDKTENTPGEVKTCNDGTESVSQNTKAVTDKTVLDSCIDIDGSLIDGASYRDSGDRDDYVNISMSFSKNLPLDTVKQVIINDIAYDIER